LTRRVLCRSKWVALNVLWTRTFVVMHSVTLLNLLVVTSRPGLLAWNSRGVITWSHKSRYGSPPLCPLAFVLSRGPHVASCAQVDSAIQHYIEAGAYASAVTAAIESKQIVRAAQLVDDTMRDPATARPFYLQIARHYHSTNALEEAEKYYVKAGEPAQAVDMYIAAGRWESSYAIARQVGELCQQALL
jgi:hypothetical protein